MVNYGYYFKKIREQHEMSLGSLATATGLAKSTLSRFENGETQLALDSFVKALSVMEMTLTDFDDFQGSSEKQSTLEQQREKKQEKTPNADGLSRVHDLVKANDLAGLLTFQLSLTDEQQLLKIICKKYLSDLGLDMLLPETDITFLQSYFKTKSHLRSSDLEVLLLCKEFLPQKIVEDIEVGKQEQEAILSVLNHHLKNAVEEQDMATIQLISILLSRLVETTKNS